MSDKKPVSLIGRLAVQLKLITPDQLQAATAEQARTPDKRLGEIFLDMGFVNPKQLEKLQQVQRDVVAKHRAKQALNSVDGTPETPPAARPAPKPAAKAAPPKPAARAAAKPAPQPAAASAAEVDPMQAALAEAEAAVGGAEPVAEAAPVAPPPGAPPAAAPAAPVAQAAAPAAQPQAPAAPVVAAAEPEETLALSLGTAGNPGDLHSILSDAVQVGASDIHLHANAPVNLRLNGRMQAKGSDPMSAQQVEQLVLAALDPDQTRRLARDGELDLCYAVDGVGRFRTNIYRQQRGFDAVFRSIPAEPPTLEELGLPTALAKYTNYHQGMVLITGPAGCGKSSTLAALVNLINEERDEHILTVEDPIEYIHKPKRCLVNQRHAGRDTASFARALRGALREDPDVIVIGELRDLETISLAMTAAETGHFVLATLHTNNAVRTVNRMIGAFPSNQQDQVRTMLSESLRAVISQRLVAKKDGSGRIPALEMLVINKAIANLIRDEKTIQIRSSIQTGGSQGMCLLEQSLNELVASGQVDKEEALRFAEEKKLITAG